VPAWKNGPGKQHGEYIESAKVNVANDPPIHESNNRSENASKCEYYARSSLQIAKKQFHNPLGTIIGVGRAIGKSA
jgi:hypothetical protein